MLKSSGFYLEGGALVASTGICALEPINKHNSERRHGHGKEMDPNAWYSIQNAKIYVICLNARDHTNLDALDTLNGNMDCSFFENISSDQLIRKIARETKAVIGGKLYSDTLSAKNGRASSYLEMMQHNVSTIVEALKL